MWLYSRLYQHRLVMGMGHLSNLVRLDWLINYRLRSLTSRDDLSGLVVGDYGLRVVGLLMHRIFWMYKNILILRLLNGQVILW